MTEDVFIINGRFTINKLRNEVFDKESGLKNRLEPRLMKLLYILAAREGQVVKREFILKEIWDDYPGANEGLNQAISFLRKLLDDEHKKIIQTQPKTGYSFHATISAKDEIARAGGRKYTAAIIIASTLLLLFALAALFYSKKNTSGGQFKQLNEHNAAELSRLDSIHQAKKMQYSKDTLGQAAKGDSDRRGK